MTIRKKRVINVNRNFLSMKKIIMILTFFCMLLIVSGFYFINSYVKIGFFYKLVLFIFCSLYVVILGYTIARLVILYIFKNKYRIELKKIKSKWYPYLEYKKYNFNQNTYKNIIETNNINELIFLSKKNGFKIKYFESVPGEKCYFLLEYNNTLYKYILTKY